MDLCLCGPNELEPKEPPLPSLLQRKKQDRLNNITLGGPMSQKTSPNIDKNFLISMRSPRASFDPSSRMNQNGRNTARRITISSNQNRQNWDGKSTERNQLIKPERGNIRLSLDQNLHKIYNELRVRKLQNTNTTNMPSLQNNLVRDYIRLVYEDYNISDPLQQIQPQKQRQVTRPSITSKNSKAVRLKQSFLIEMFSPGENRYPSTPHSPKRTQQSHEHTREFTSSGNKISKTYPIKQCYRYCFICEQPILEVNVEAHEKQKCPEFCSLYQLSLPELRETLLKKVRRLAEEALSYLPSAPVLAHDFQKLQAQTCNYLQMLENNLSMPKAKLKHNFQSVMECFESDYFKMYSTIRKVQWFSLMLKNLEDQYGGVLEDSRSNFTKMRNQAQY